MRIIGFEDTETPAQVICYRFKSGESLHQGWSWIWLGNALIVVPNATMTKRDEKPHLDRAPRAHSPPESHRWFTPLGKLSCRVRQPCGYNSLVRSIRVPGPLGREPPLRGRSAGEWRLKIHYSKFSNFSSLSLIFIRFLDSIANGALITIANGALVIARLQLVSASGRRAGRPITVIPLKGSYTSA